MSFKIHFCLNFLLNKLLIIVFLVIRHGITSTKFFDVSIIPLTAFSLYVVILSIIFCTYISNNSKTKIFFILLNLVSTPFFIVYYIIYSNFVVENQENKWLTLPMIAISILIFVLYTSFLYFCYQRKPFSQMFLNFWFIKMSTGHTILKIYYIFGSVIMIGLIIINFALNTLTGNKLITVITLVIVFILFVYVFINLLNFAFFKLPTNTSKSQKICNKDNEFYNVSIFKIF